MGNTSSAPERGFDPVSDPSTPEYWRQKGNALATARNEAFAASQAAYRSGNRARAGELSREGKAYAAKADEAHKRAAEIYMTRNNARRTPDELDLHGLRVKEAIAEVERALAQARACGQTKLVLIVGRGLHSPDGVSKLRPAIEGLVRRHNLRVTPGVPNAGCITVELVSKAERGWVGWLVDTVCVIC